MSPILKMCAIMALLLTSAGIPTLAQSFDIHADAVRQFGMIFMLPAAARVIERKKEFLPAHLAFGNSRQERAAVAFSEEMIDVRQKGFRQEHMCALLGHEYAMSICAQ